MTTTIIRVADLTGASHAATADDGARLHDAITRALRDDEPVMVSFDGIESLADEFLDASITHLYATAPADLLDDHLSFIQLTVEQMQQIERARQRGEERTATGTPQDSSSR